MAHNLLLNYGLYKKMEIYRPAPASFDEMAKFHSEEYLSFLRAINPDNVGEYTKQMTVPYVRPLRCILAARLHPAVSFAAF